VLIGDNEVERSKGGFSMAKKKKSKKGKKKK